MFPTTPPEGREINDLNNIFFLNNESENLSQVPSDIVIKCNIKYGNKWSACKGLMAEYSKSSTVHGLRYVFEIHRPLYEKVVWLFLVLISSVAAIILMRASYFKWLNSPIVVAFDESLVPIYKIPFPTVTICPEIKAGTKQFDFNRVSEQVWSEIEANNQFKNLANISDVEMQQFIAMLQICENDVVERFAPYIQAEYDVHDRAVEIMVNLTWNLNALMACSWNTRLYAFDTLFRLVLTEDGICHQFNGLNAEDIYRDPGYLSYYDDRKMDYNEYIDYELPKLDDIRGTWSLEEGYVGQGSNAYPQRSIISSSRNGFKALMVGVDSDFEYACRSYKQGYKVFINSPESVPFITSNYILVPHDNELLVSLIPYYVTSTKNVHMVDPEKRQCYFSNERYLKFFKSYSQSNCETECLTNLTISQCGCAKFWMPKPRHVPVCGLADASCCKRAVDKINSLSFKQTNKTSENGFCDCKPSCFSLDYDFEISRASFDVARALSAFRDRNDYSELRASRLSIHFNEPNFTAIKRTVVYGFTQLIANFGGILGLLLGTSLLSIAEFVYFFPLRFLHNIYKRKMATNKLQLLEDNLPIE